MPFSLLWTKEVFFSFYVTQMMALRDLPLIFFYMQHGQTKEFSRFCIAIIPLCPMNHIILKWLYLSMFKTFACQNFSSLLLHKINMTKTTLPDASSIKFPHLCHRLHKDHKKKNQQRVKTSPLTDTVRKGSIYWATSLRPIFSTHTVSSVIPATGRGLGNKLPFTGKNPPGT